MTCKLFSLFSAISLSTEIYTLSLHDALPISETYQSPGCRGVYGLPTIVCVVRSQPTARYVCPARIEPQDRKSRRLNSSHLGISYAVFCLKKKSRLRSRGRRRTLRRPPRFLPK